LAQATECKRQLLDRAAEVFDDAGKNNENEPNLKVLYAKIAQQALEIDFLGTALTKAGLLSAEK
jgi:transposase